MSFSGSFHSRGDLGVELELERVPFAQKLLIARAKKVWRFGLRAMMGCP